MKMNDVKEDSEKLVDFIKIRDELQEQLKTIKQCQMEIIILKKLLEDLKEMNSVEPLSFGTVESTIWEYICARQVDVERLFK